MALHQASPLARQHLRCSCSSREPWQHPSPVVPLCRASSSQKDTRWCRRRDIATQPPHSALLRRRHLPTVPAAALAGLAGSSAVVEWLFVAGTLYTLPFFLLMVIAPNWRGTQRLLRPDSIFVPLALMYGVLLVRSWAPDTLALMMPGSLREGFTGGRVVPQFFPSLDGIVKLFSRPATAASLWIHLLCINLFAARWAYFDGLRQRFPTRISVLLAAAFGPLGVLSHFLTQATIAIWRGGFNRAQEPLAAP